ncbi:signal transducer and activator of transcription 6 isoform 2-T2 [Discoglossus pictus]
MNMAKVSVWSYVSKMPSEQFEQLYCNFPQTVRNLLGDWLENQPWEYINVNDPFCIEMANSLIQKLVEEFEKIARIYSSEAPLVLRCAEEVKGMSQLDPMKLVTLFKNIVEGERSLVVEQYPRLAMSFNQKQEEMKFNVLVSKLQHKIKQAAMIQEQLRRAKETHHYQEVASLQGQWDILTKESYQLLDNARMKANQRLNIWKRQQQLAGNGGSFNENLLPLQERLEILFTMYSEIMRIIKFNELNGEQVHTGLSEKINTSLGLLIKSSLLVDKQPPQVLKTQTKFQAGVNFLLGSRILSSATRMPVVKAIIITEKRAQELYLASVGESWNEGAGEIENGTSTFEITPTTKNCIALFKNMLLKKIKRCERKGSESVTEEKCAILFTVNIQMNSCNIALQVLSLPLVVIVHGNQDNNAKATILWDNAFSELDRRPFFVEDKVPWPQMCQTLNMKFVSEVGTKHHLGKEHFWFLAQKIFNDNSINKDFKDCTVSWAQFNKELLRERNFTFWQWFDGVVELTKKCLKSYWSDGLIIGFISKQYVHKLLIKEPDGTFLLRFSDSEIGGISIAHILRGDNGSPQIQNIQPFTLKDLNIRSLGDRVKDLKQLKFLYPRKPKDEAFEKYYTKDPDLKNGYKLARIEVKVVEDSDNLDHNAMDTQSSSGMDGFQDASHMTPLQSAMYPASPLANSPIHVAKEMEITIPGQFPSMHGAMPVSIPVLHPVHNVMHNLPTLYSDNMSGQSPQYNAIEANLQAMHSISSNAVYMDQDVVPPLTFSQQQQTLQEEHTLQSILSEIYDIDKNFQPQMNAELQLGTQIHPNSFSVCQINSNFQQ